MVSFLIPFWHLNSASQYRNPSNANEWHDDAAVACGFLAKRSDLISGTPKRPWNICPAYGQFMPKAFEVVLLDPCTLQKHQPHRLPVFVDMALLLRTLRAAVGYCARTAYRPEVPAKQKPGVILLEHVTRIKQRKSIPISRNITAKCASQIGSCDIFGCQSFWGGLPKKPNPNVWKNVVPWSVDPLPSSCESRQFVNHQSIPQPQETQEADLTGWKWRWNKFMQEIGGRATKAYANLHPFHPPTQQLRIRIVFCIPTATSMLRV